MKCCSKKDVKYVKTYDKVTKNDEEKSVFLLVFCFTRVNSDMLSLNSIAFLEVKNYVSHWIQHEIISKDFKQSF